MSERPEESSANYQGRSSGDIAARIAEIAVGYLTVVGILFYPIGLIALSLHIWNAHSYELSEALFAVSFAPVTVAAGKIYDFLTWGLIAIGAVEEISWLKISWLIVWRRNYLALPDDALSSLSEQEREEWRRSEERHYKFMRRSLIISAVLVLTAPVALQLIYIVSWKTVVLYIAFLFFSCVGGVVGGLLTLLFGAGNIGRNWKANAVGYTFAILAGISLTGTLSPSLPLVEFASAAQEEGQLLGRTDGYWYVFDQQGTLVAVPDDEAGGVRFLQH
jgi:hypothetical protein